MKPNIHYLRLRTVTVGLICLLLSACEFNDYIDFDGTKQKKIYLLQLHAGVKQLRVDTQLLTAENTATLEGFTVHFDLVTRQIDRQQQAEQNQSQLFPQWRQLTVLKEDLTRRHKFFIAVYQDCVGLTAKLNRLTASIDELATALVAAHANQKLIYQVTRMLFIAERMKYSLAVIKRGQGEESAAILDRLGRDTVVLAKQIDQARWVISKAKLQESQLDALLDHANKLRSMNNLIHVAIGGTLERSAEYFSYLSTIDKTQKLLAEVDNQLQKQLQALEPSVRAQQ